MTLSEDEMVSTYAQAVGARLRSVRKQKKLSLQAVEAISDLEFKASVLGAYERGERSISVPRLQRLAALYDVPIKQLLPREIFAAPMMGEASGAAQEREAESVAALDERSHITIDLNRLDEADGPERDVLKRFVSSIAELRQDFNGQMMSVRRDDLRLIAGILSLPVDALLGRLDDLGVRMR